MAGRTVVCTTDLHRPFKWNGVSELCDGAAGRTVAGSTARQRLRNPRRGQISLNVLRDVLDYSYYNYKFSGLVLII